MRDRRQEFIIGLSAVLGGSEFSDKALEDTLEKAHLEDVKGDVG